MLRNFEVSNLMKLGHMGSLICHCELLVNCLWQIEQFSSLVGSAEVESDIVLSSISLTKRQ